MRSIMALCLLGLSFAVSSCGGGDGDKDGQRGYGTSTGAAGPFGTLSIDVRVDPPETGSEDSPTPVKLDLAMALGAVEDIEPPQVQQLAVTFPAGTRYGGDQIAACKLAVLKRGGPEACPPDSVTGQGRLVAYADTARSPGRITVINGGPQATYLWTVLDRPVRVEAPIVGRIDPASDGYELTLDVPPKLQVVAGVPIALRELRLSAQQGSWLTTTGCPDGKWAITGSATFSDGTMLEQAAEVDCD